MVSHGGHRATEGFLADDQTLDAGLKLSFANIKNRAETQILRRMYVRTCNIYQSSVPTAASVRCRRLLCWRFSPTLIAMVSHGGHRATEGFLAVDHCVEVR